MLRFMVAIMAVLCPVVCYMGRQNINFAIIAMVKCNENSTNDIITTSLSKITETTTIATFASNLTNQSLFLNQTANSILPVLILDDGDATKVEPDTSNAACTETYGPKFHWTMNQKNHLLSAFSWSYVVAQIPGARLAEILGPMWVLLFATVGTSAMNLITPAVAAWSYPASYVVRLLIGLFQASLFPACYVLCTKWLPPKERVFVLPILNLGAFVGAIIASSSTTYFNSQSMFGWEYAFYLPSAATFLWSAIWFLMGADSPRDHRCISTTELDYIESRLEREKEETDPPIDWFKILASRQILVAIFIQVCSGWSFNLILALIPTYLNDIIKIPMPEIGDINSLMYLIFCIAAPSIGIASALMLRNRKTLKMTSIQIRKLFECIAIYGQFACFIWLTQIGISKSRISTVLYVQIFIYSFVNGCECHIANEISYQFAGTIYAIGNALGSSTGIIVPLVNSAMVSDPPDKDSWDNFFYLASGISFAGATTFLLFGGNDPEDFSLKNGTIKPILAEEGSEGEDDVLKFDLSKNLVRQPGIVNGERDYLGNASKDYQSIDIGKKVTRV